MQKQGAMAQGVKHLPTEHKVLHSNPTTALKKKKLNAFTQVL
jgi:hypothetical protein